MDLTSGCPFWPLKNGLLANYPPLERDVSCEVAIIGGGITGALVAYHLAEAGIDVVVVDERDMGTGSTAASTCLLQYEVDVPLHQLIGKVGEHNAVRSYEICRDALGKIGRIAKKLGDPQHCSFEKQESLYLASAQADLPGLKLEYAARKKYGFDVDWWTRGQLAAESTLPQKAAILSKDAAQIDSYRFTQFLLQAAQKKGARLYDRTEVTRRTFRPRGVDLLTSRGARVRARKLVIATGYAAQDHLPEKVCDLNSTYALISEPIESLAGWPGRRLLWETARPYVYLRTTDDGRIIMGGYDEPFRDPKARDALLPVKIGMLKRRFHQLMPKIKLDVAYAWAGTFAETKDGLPYIGEHPARPHTYFALGYGGNGITYSLIAAEIIRDLCAEEFDGGGTKNGGNGKRAVNGKDAERTRVDMEIFKFGRKSA